MRELTTRPAAPIPAGVWEFAQGYAELRKGDREAAARHRDGAQNLAVSSTEMFRIHPAKKLLGILAAILDGEIARDAGNLSSAVTSFEAAVSIEDSLVWDEPEPLPFAARHWLGAALLEAGRPSDAARVYRADLKRHPHNGWSLVGLRQALVAQGQPAREVSEEFDRSWVRSDVWIQASRF